MSCALECPMITYGFLLIKIHAALAILPSSTPCMKPGTQAINMLRHALLKVRSRLKQAASLTFRCNLVVERSKNYCRQDRLVFRLSMTYAVLYHTVFQIRESFSMHEISSRAFHRRLSCKASTVFDWMSIGSDDNRPPKYLDRLHAP